jgi:hypothetical protein
MKNENKNLYVLIWQGQVVEFIDGEHLADMSEYVRKSFLKNLDMCNMSDTTIKDIEKIKNTTDFVHFSITHLISINSDIKKDKVINHNKFNKKKTESAFST